MTTQRVEKAIEIEASVAQAPAVRVPDPSWEDASLMLGIPGAVGSSLLTAMLAMYGAQGNALAAWTGIGLVLGGYFGMMTVLWIGVASVSRR